MKKKIYFIYFLTALLFINGMMVISYSEGMYNELAGIVLTVSLYVLMITLAIIVFLFWRCPYCGSKLWFSKIISLDDSYCPHCGKKMF